MKEAVRRWIKRVVQQVEFLDLKASIHYNSSGKRYSRIRERFWDMFSERMEKGELEKAFLSIEAFMALRKAPRFRRH